MKLENNIEIDSYLSENKLYEKPSIEIIEIENCGVLASSGPDFGEGGSWS